MGMIIHHYPYYRGSFLLNVLKVPRDGNPSMGLMSNVPYHVPKRNMKITSTNVTALNILHDYHMPNIYIYVNMYIHIYI
jgi:hypothetical protein